MSERKVYLISNIEEYGKLMAYCIEHDIVVFRTYWNEKEKGNRCFEVNFKDKRCYYSSKEYYFNEGYNILIPVFDFNKFGTIIISRFENAL